MAWTKPAYRRWSYLFIALFGWFVFDIVVFAKGNVTGWDVVGIIVSVIMAGFCAYAAIDAYINAWKP